MYLVTCSLRVHELIDEKNVGLREDPKEGGDEWKCSSCHEPIALHLRRNGKKDYAHRDGLCNLLTGDLVQCQDVLCNGAVCRHCDMSIGGHKRECKEKEGFCRVWR